MNYLKTIAVELLCVIALCPVWQTNACAQTDYSEKFELQVMGIMAELNTPENRGLYHNIPDDDGRILRLAVRLTGAKRALEVGTSNGYSAIWMGLGLKETGGTLTTIEIDAERHRMAQENLRKAGLSDVVTAVHGDAAEVIPGLEGPFDVAFVDLGQGELSRKFFELILPKLRTGGVILFHAVQGQRGGMPEFVEHLKSHPQLDTFIIPITRPGISLSYKTH